MHTVIIDTARPDLRDNIRFIFDTFGVNLRDKLVLVKPNIIGVFPIEQGVTTNPAVVRAVVDVLLEQGARVVVGDNPGGVEGNSFLTAQRVGIVDASRGCFTNISERVVTVPISSGVTDSVLVSKVLFEADYFINLPKFKTHTLTTISGAIKNLYGLVAGSAKAMLHLKAKTSDRFCHLLVDINQLRPPDLSIMDALTVMEGNGPSHGHSRPLGKLLASTNVAALDAVMVTMMGADPAQVELLRVAAARGLGPIDLREIDIVGELQPIPNFQLPTTFTISVREQGQLLKEIGTVVPTVEEAACITCGECETNCPPQAITMDPFPTIDKTKCISCFCCTEMCPENAIKVPEVLYDLWDKALQ